MKEGVKEFVIIGGLALVAFLFMRRGGTPMQQQSGQVPNSASAAPVDFGPYYLSYNQAKGHIPTLSSPGPMARAANGNLPVCTACDEQILFGGQNDFARYLQTELSGVYAAYRANILSLTPDWLDQYLVR